MLTPTVYAKSYEPIEELQRDCWIILEQSEICGRKKVQDVYVIIILLVTWFCSAYTCLYTSVYKEYFAYEIFTAEFPPLTDEYESPESRDE